MGIYGIDLSNNNGQITFPSVVPNLGFVMAKASEGTNFTDQTFSFYRTQAENRGLVFGAYHFAHPENKDPEAEADLFVKSANPVSGMLLAIDYESFSGSVTYDASWINTFRDRVRVHCPGAKVGLYADLSAMKPILPLVSVDWLWLAYWNSQPETPSAPLTPYSWTIHQFGVFSNVDVDYSRLSASELRTMSAWDNNGNNNNTWQDSLMNALPTLKLNDTDANSIWFVHRVQTILKDVYGYYNGAVDGSYGPETVAAVKQLQARYKITQDGITGPQTWACLYTGAP